MLENICHVVPKGIGVALCGFSKNFVEAADLPVCPECVRALIQIASDGTRFAPRSVPLAPSSSEEVIEFAWAA